MLGERKGQMATTLEDRRLRGGAVSKPIATCSSTANPTVVHTTHHPRHTTNHNTHDVMLGKREEGKSYHSRRG